MRLAGAGLLLALVVVAFALTGPIAALPAIAADLHGADRTTWPVISALLAAAVALPVCDKLGELLGRRGVFCFAALVFAGGSALAGWSRTMGELIVFRAVQGVGAGGVLIGALAITAAVLPRRRRATALLGAACGLAAAAGPLLGGYLADHTSWRWCCYLTVPLGLLALALVLPALRLPRPTRRGRFEVFGALFTAAAALALVLLTSWGGTERTWEGRIALGLGLGALGTVIVGVAVAYFAREPVTPLRLARESLCTVDTLVGAVLGVALFGAASCLPAHLHRLDGASAASVGLWLLPLLGGLFVAATGAGRLVGRTGRSRGLRACPVLGCALAAVGIGLLCRPAAADSRPLYGLCTGLLGLGLGLVLPALVLAVRQAARPTAAGGATGRARRIGGGAAAAVFLTLFADRTAAHLRRKLPDGTDDLFPETVRALPDALRDGYLAAYLEPVPRAFLYLLPVLVLGFLLALLLKEIPVAPQTDQHDATVPAARGLPDALTNGAPALPAEQRTTDPYDIGYGTDAYRTDGHAGRYAAELTRADAPSRTEGPPVAGAPVCGTVAHHDGSTVPRAALTLIDVGGRQVGRGATGEDGRYALSTPGAGAYVLIAAAGGHQPQAVSVTVGERPVELDVVLGGAGRLAGTVHTADGTPVRDAMVTLTDVRGEVVASTRSGREGGYLITELVAGEYTLASSAPAYRPAALPVSVQSARETRQDIELAGGAVLRGTVRAGGGRVVEDARVTLLDAAGNVVDTATTGADGGFRFIDLSAGEYTVIAAGYPPVATVLRVAGGGRTERDLHLGYEDER
ncbi:MFS transporter [Streptomyces sp. 796.1]|uniref:MFS transporter n=1 Tax=Streptomyces sp. 796.1 TaxID=3163029 RepID=UPI0039C9C3DB